MVVLDVMPHEIPAPHPHVGRAALPCDMSSVSITEKGLQHHPHSLWLGRLHIDIAQVAVSMGCRRRIVRPGGTSAGTAPPRVSPCTAATGLRSWSPIGRLHRLFGCGFLCSSSCGSLARSAASDGDAAGVQLHMTPSGGRCSRS